MDDSTRMPETGTIPSTVDAKQIHVVPRFDVLRLGTSESIEIVASPNGEQSVYLQIDRTPDDIDVAFSSSQLNLQSGTGQVTINAKREKRFAHLMGGVFQLPYHVWSSDGKIGEGTFTLKVPPVYAIFAIPAVLLVGLVVLFIVPRLLSTPSQSTVISTATSDITDVPTIGSETVVTQPVTDPPPASAPTNTESPVSPIPPSLVTSTIPEQSTASPTACVKTCNLHPDWTYQTVPDGTTPAKMFGVNQWAEVLRVNCIASDKEFYSGTKVCGPPQ
ncbi:MAG: hypothetical protein R3E39_08030 [Anaerolineae bacterium]